MYTMYLKIKLFYIDKDYITLRVIYVKLEVFYFYKHSDRDIFCRMNVVLSIYVYVGTLSIIMSKKCFYNNVHARYYWGKHNSEIIYIESPHNCV